MKKLSLFLLINFCSFSLSNAQDRVQKLIAEIKASNTIECIVLGYAGMPSALFMKADTLNGLLSAKDKIQLFNDSSYVLKYYCFHYLLSDKDNDSVVFELLKKVINDTSEVAYYCSCLIDIYPFNGLLVEEYYHFIQSKYKDGNPTVLGNSNKVYMFSKPDKKSIKKNYIS
ncbi:hypothetical protein [Cytophaga aurantiaca]|uniref:hypothetical protein n=1 Tax=Cytophaga aurantiaca TaxID=29530 RepID=UPI00035CAB84|nr:hypothetical protein [Cytophaga aurantiaca]